MQHGQHGGGGGSRQVPIKSSNFGTFSPDLAETLKMWMQYHIDINVEPHNTMHAYICIFVYLRKSSNPSSLLAFSRASKVTPPSLSPSRSHLLIAITENLQSLGPDSIQTASRAQTPPVPQKTPENPPENWPRYLPNYLNFKQYFWRQGQSSTLLVHEKQPWLVLRNLLLPHRP